MQALVVGPQLRNVPLSVAPLPPNLEVTIAECFPNDAVLVRPNPIDRALAVGKPFQLRFCDAAYDGTPKHPPAWLMATCGSVNITNPQSGIVTAIPRYWQLPYVEARGVITSELARAYDGQLSLVFNSFGMHVYAEPFIKGLADEATRKNLFDAGYSTELDQLAQLAGLGAHAAFRETRIGFALNPYQALSSDGASFTNDMTFVTTYCEQARSILGAQACLGNNSVRESYISNAPTDYRTLYDTLTAFGPPLRFQTATLARVGNLAKVMDHCISTLHAYAVELPAGYEKVLSPAMLASYRERMKANVA